MFEDRVLRGVIETKREQVAGGERKLQNEGLHDLYY
jgi:hypothetical protein